MDIPPKGRSLLVLLLLLLMPTAAAAIQFHVSHSDPIAPVIIGVTGILFVALIGNQMHTWANFEIR